MKRTLSIVLLICFMVSALVFAGGNKESGGAAEGRVLPNMEGLRIVDEPITMSAFVGLNAGQSDMESLSFIQFIQEETGINWEFETALYGDEFNQKENLIFASGDFPDVVMTTSLPSFVVKQAEYGNIIPLNDLIDNYTVNIKRILEERDDINSVLKHSDGNIYSLWGIDEYVAHGWKEPYLINHVWLDKLGLDYPTSLEEFKKVLIAFRDNDANGNGDPNDEIPFSWRETGWAGQRIDTFFGAFGIRDSKDDNHVGYEDEKAFITAGDSRYRTALEYLHELYADGLLDPEAFIQDMAQLRAKAQAGILGSCVFYWPVNIFGGEKVKEYSLMLPLKSPDSVPTAYRADYITGFEYSKYIISNSNPYPEVSIRFADILMDGGEMSLNVAYGSKGYFWEPYGNDQWWLNGALIPEGLGEVQFRDAVTNFNLPKHVDRDLTEKQYASPGSKGEVRTKWYRQIEDLITTSPQPPFWFPVEVNAEVATVSSDLKAYVEEMRARFVLDGVSDASWNEYIANIENLGGSRLVEIYQSAYDSFYSN